MSSMNFIPLKEAWICPECDMLRKGPGACACGNTETVPAMRALTHPEDRPRIVAFRAAAIRMMRGPAGRRALARTDVLGTDGGAA